MSDRGHNAGESVAVRATAAALLVDIEELGAEIWIPQSVIHDDSEVFDAEDNAAGDLVVGRVVGTKAGVDLMSDLRPATPGELCPLSLSILRTAREQALSAENTLDGSPIRVAAAVLTLADGRQKIAHVEVEHGDHDAVQHMAEFCLEAVSGLRADETLRVVTIDYFPHPKAYVTASATYRKPEVV